MLIQTGIEGRRFALVGGTSGMGFAAAQILVASGARVALIGRDADAAATKANSLDSGAIGLGSDNGGIEDTIADAHERLGGLNGLAVTAGPIASRGGLLDLADADWQESFDTIFMLTMRSMRAAIPLLAAGGGGSIVTTAAYSVRAPKQALPHYAAMKAAVASLTKNVAIFHAAQGIRANCVAPGAIATEALDSARDASALRYPDLDAEAALNRLMVEDWGMQVAQNRVGLPHEAGELIAFLLSPAAAYMTGALINIDGGTNF
ncbi:MAG: SDR family oxidoreductase [Blastomonas sp.]